MKIHDIVETKDSEYVLYVNNKELIRSTDLAHLENLKKQFPMYKVEIKKSLPKTESTRYILMVNGTPQAVARNQHELYDVMMHVKQANPGADVKIEVKKDAIKESKILSEGITFSPTILVKQSDGTIHADTTPFYKEIQNPCPECNGKGSYASYDNPNVQVKCPYCFGRGYWREQEPLAPELQVSNMNGFIVQEILGLEPDYSGTIMHEDLPATMRRLIALKNRNRSHFTREPSVSQGPMRARTNTQGMTSIGRGPTMIDAGVSPEQINRYIDKLIELVKFAQENNASIGWG